MGTPYANIESLPVCVISCIINEVRILSKAIFGDQSQQNPGVRSILRVHSKKSTGEGS